ncbi:PAS domain-containing protein [Burkholderia multivorans]|uniref:PAS domain-containing protein n=1 Tax=Burkholderia multivorans TaxID=87883 RepID=UPI0020194E08|nr:PAS domain-containing protein [Burkholderia multivorans]UQN56152.1 PAS domain-containing protein [Burkholderia multivorans]
MMAAALDALPRAVIVVDDTLRVRYLNAAASALLGESTELRVQADRLVASSPQVAPQLAQRVKDACARRTSPRRNRCMRSIASVARRSEIQVVPLKPQLTASLDR